MTARTADPAYFPVLPVSTARNDSIILAAGENDVVDRNLGAFRGLFYAVILETLLAVIGIGAWEVLRRIF